MTLPMWELRFRKELWSPARAGGARIGLQVPIVPCFPRHPIMGLSVSSSEHEFRASGTMLSVSLGARDLTQNRWSINNVAQNRWSVNSVE